MHRRPISQRGFTLVEVLFAVFIIAGALVIFAGVMMGSTRQARAGSSTTQAVFAATEMLELEAARIKNTGVSALSCYGATETKEYGGTTYEITSQAAKLVLDAATGDLVPAAHCPTATDVAAYELSLVLAWAQDGVPLQESYSEVIATTAVTAPQLDYFHTSAGNASYFVANPPEATTLSWQTTIGTQPLDVRLTGTDGTARRSPDLRHTDTIEVAPTESTRYTLNISNSADSVTSAAIVYVDDIEVDSFEAAPPIVGPEEAFELAWRYTATLDPEFEIARIDQGIGDVTASTSHPSEVTTISAGPITADTTYTLLVETPEPKEEDRLPLATAATTVRYSAKPVIDTFTATPAAQCRAPGGNLVDLTWLVYAADHITLDGGSLSSVEVASSGARNATITDSTVITLTATNALGVAQSRQLPVDIVEYPEVALTLNGESGTTTIIEGEPVILEWSAVPATQAYLDDSPRPTAGSATFYPQTGRAYELVASNGDCEALEQASVTVRPIRFASAAFDNPETTAGHAATLRWAFTETLNPLHHQVVLIEDGVERDVTNWSSTTITPETVGAHNYTLVLYARDDGTGNRREIQRRNAITLNAIEPPVIDALTASRAAICEGSATLIQWSTRYAQYTTLSSVSGHLATSTSHEVTPTATTLYELTAVNRLGHATKATVEVHVTANPVIEYFYFTHEEVPTATPSEANWSVAGSERAHIMQGAASLQTINTSLAPQGSTRFWLDGPGGDYYLRAEIDTPGGEETCIDVSPPAPVVSVPIKITKFEGVFPGITAKGSQELEWEITPYIDPEWHRVELTGPKINLDVTDATSEVVSIDTNRDGETLGFYLRVYDRHGGSKLAEAYTTLEVVPPAEVRGFSVSPTTVCRDGVVQARYDFRRGTGIITWPDNLDPGLGVSATNLFSPTGRANLNVTQSGNVTITVTSLAGDTASASRAITVNAPAEITSFTASKTTAAFAGEPITLTWNVSGAATQTLNGETVSASGSKIVHPTSTTTYTLSASAPGWPAGCPPVTERVTVLVPAGLAPQITSFTADSSHGLVGHQTTLRWTLQNYNPTYHSLTLVGPDPTADVSNASSRNTTFRSGAHTYRLELRSRNAPYTLFQTRSLSITGGTPPDLNVSTNNQYTCTTSNVTRTISWSASNATRVTVNGVNHPTSGSLTMSVNHNTTVTITAYNDYGSTTRTIPFSQGTMPSFTSATVSAGPVTGSNYRISWTTSNASSVTVSGVSGSYGANTSVLTSTQTAGSRTHTLTARNNASGCTATRNVTTYVNRATYTIRSIPHTNPAMNPNSDPRPGCLSGALCHNQFGNTTSSFAGRYSEMPSKRLRITAGHAKSASNYVETSNYPRLWLWTAYHHMQSALVKLTGLAYGGQQWRSYVDIPANQTSSWRQMRYELIWKVDWNPFGSDHGFHVDLAFRFNGNNLEVRTTNQQMYLNTWNNHAGAAFRVDVQVMP